MSPGGTGALMHALDIAVRIEAGDGKEPVWVKKEDEAGNWIFDTAHAFVRDVFSGRVQVDRDRIESGSFTRTLAVFALPTPTHASILQGDTTGLSDRLAADLAAKFGSEHKKPQVTLTPIRAFISEASPMHAGAGHQPGMHGQSQQSPYGAAQMWNNAPPQSPQQGQGPSTMMPVPMMPQLFQAYQPQQPAEKTEVPKNGPWLGPTGVLFAGIMLGVMSIAAAGFGFVALDKQREIVELNETIRLKDEDISKRINTIADQETELRTLRIKYAYEKDELEEINDLKAEIARIANDKYLSQPVLPKEPDIEEEMTRATAQYIADLRELRDRVAKASANTRPQRIR